MNRARPHSLSGDPQAPSPKRTRARLRVSCSRSPLPSFHGDGETFARALAIRPSLVVVCLRNERQRGGDSNRNVQIFRRRASAPPLLGERDGVRGPERQSTLHCNLNKRAANKWLHARTLGCAPSRTQSTRVPFQHLPGPTHPKLADEVSCRARA